MNKYLKNIVLFSLILFLANCTTTAKKFSKKKENCKKLHTYFTQSKDCLGLSFQTY